MTNRQIKSLLSIPEINDQFLAPDFILKTQQQVVKDFNRSGIDFDPRFEKEQLSYDEIVGTIGQKLSEVMQQGEKVTLQLLYQIDIPQGEFLSLTSDSDFIAKMSELILRREAYKVYLRSKF